MPAACVEVAVEARDTDAGALEAVMVCADRFVVPPDRNLDPDPTRAAPVDRTGSGSASPNHAATLPVTPRSTPERSPPGADRR